MVKPVGQFNRLQQWTQPDTTLRYTPRYAQGQARTPTARPRATPTGRWYIDPNSGERRQFMDAESQWNVMNANADANPALNIRDGKGYKELEIVRQAAERSGIPLQQLYEYRLGSMGPEASRNAALWQGMDTAAMDQALNPIQDLGPAAKQSLFGKVVGDNFEALASKATDLVDWGGKEETVAVTMPDGSVKYVTRTAGMSNSDWLKSAGRMGAMAAGGVYASQAAGANAGGGAGGGAGGSSAAPVATGAEGYGAVYAPGAGFGGGAPAATLGATGAPVGSGAAAAAATGASSVMSPYASSGGAVSTGGAAGPGAGTSATTANVMSPYASSGGITPGMATGGATVTSGGFGGGPPEATLGNTGAPPGSTAAANAANAVNKGNTVTDAANTFLGLTGAELGMGIGSSILNYLNANRAADQLADSTGAAINAITQADQQTRADLAPFVQGGANIMDPLYQFVLQGPETELERAEGFRQIQNSAAAGPKGLRSGNTLLELTEFNNMLNARNRSQRFGELFNLATLGANAAARQGTNTTNTATNVANLLTGQGSANAAGTIGGNNAMNSFLELLMTNSMRGR